MSTLDASDLELHLRHVRRRAPDGRAFAIHFEGRPPVSEVTVDGEPWRVEHAPSELALRTLLTERDDDERLVILTPMHNQSMPEDVEARLAGHEIYQIDPWASVATLFEASSIDPDLRWGEHARDVARVLLESLDAERVDPVAGGVLDADTAWRTFQRHGLDQREPAVELADWMRWAVESPSAVRRLFETHDGLVPALKERLHDALGPAGEAWVEVLRAARDRSDRPGLEAMAVGLAYRGAGRAEEREDDRTATRAQAQLESPRYTGGERALSGETMRVLAKESERACRPWLSERDAEGYIVALQERVDELFERLVPEEGSHLVEYSPFSREGWTRRLDHLADALRMLLSGETDALDDVCAHLQALREHAEGRRRPERLETFEHLARLTSRLSQADDVDGDLGAMARRYLSETSVVDALRERLAGADVGPELAPIAEDVLAESLERSDRRNERFARLLADDLRDRRATRHGLPIQHALGRAVAPVSDTHPVLLVVLDGLNWAVLRWLLWDETLEGWEPWHPVDEEGPMPMFATIPSETGYSRTSLLTGTLQSGRQSLEERTFARALHEAGGVETPDAASLFHKAELDAAGRGRVGGDVEEAILDEDQQVVGVVVNAIDDQLSGSDQLDVEWSIDQVTPLRSLLELARNRVVFIASDHGHVWESGTDYRGRGEGSRWRQSSGDLRDGEQLCSGPMIQTLTGEDEIVAAASERIRYSHGHRGYHGGVTMQEIITPLLALVPRERNIEVPGHGRHLEGLPDWWRLDASD